MRKQLPDRFHPGEYIREEMKVRNMALTELALTMKINPRILGALLRHQCDVDQEIAEGLGRAFGTGEEVWLNLQKAYDEGRVRPSLWYWRRGLA